MALGASNAKLVVEIITDASQAGKGIDEATGKFGKFNTVMGNLVAPATAVLGGITALGVVAVNAASDLQQAAGGTEAVFGDSAKQIEAWAKTSASSVGLSSAAYQTFAAQIGAQLKNLGVPMDQVAGKTNDLISLGADLAATYGGTTEEAVSALGAAFRGEADPAERYGLALNQTAVNAELAARGQDKLQGSALQAAKAQAIMEMATKQAGGAVGQFAKESDTLSGQQQRLNAQLADMSAELGTALLPILTPVVAALAEFAKWVQQNTTLVTVIIGVIGALAVAVIAYTVAQWAMNVALTANPIGIIVALIALLIAGLIALAIVIYKNLDGIKAMFKSLGDSIQNIWATISAWFISTWRSIVSAFSNGLDQIGSFFSTIFNGIKSIVNSVLTWFQNLWASVMGSALNPVNAIVAAFEAVVGAIKKVIDWISKIKIPDLGAIGRAIGIGGQSFAVSGSAVPMSVFSASGVGAVSSAAMIGARVAAGGTVINVSGGLDSADTIARRIRQILDSRDRRESGVRIVRSAT
jgi:phage-related protein